MKAKAAFLALSFLFLLPPTTAWSTSPGSPVETNAAVPSERIDIPAVSSLTFKPSATMTAGATSNATLLPTPTPGIYGKVTPSIAAEYAPLESLFVSSAIEGSFRRFSDASVGPLANENRVSAKSDITWNLDESWEVGSNLSFSYLQNHIPVVGETSLEAISQQYYQPEGRLYGAWTGDSWSIEVGTSGTTRRYDTTTFDLEGNVYRNTYNEIRADAKTGYRWSKGFKVQLKSSLEQRSYQERMAEFSDGLPAFPGSVHPLLAVLAQDNELQLDSRVSSVRLVPALGIRFEKDLVYGARDSVQVKLRWKVEIPLPGRFTLQPNLGLSRQAFSTFRSDPVNDARNSATRVDWEGHFGTAVTLPITKLVTAQAQYTLNRKLSNFIFENYVEHMAETTLDVKF